MDDQLDAALEQAGSRRDNLFAYPAQSNFSSVQHPLGLDRARPCEGLGCAAGCGCLRAHQPARSFPLQAGFRPALVLQDVRLSHRLGCPHRSPGQAPQAASSLVRRRHDHSSLRAGRQVLYGGRTHGFRRRHGRLSRYPRCRDRLTPPRIDRHAPDQAACPVPHRLAAREPDPDEHSTGIRLVNVYGPTDTRARGGAITVNFFDQHGKAIDHRSIEELANRHKISLRTGCFCNPGAGEVALGISRVELDVCFTSPDHADRLTLDDFRLCIDGKSTGAVRISVGLVTNFADVQAFLQFCEGLLD
jgi:molybdenum cofactor sulfurtransferase